MRYRPLLFGTRAFLKAYIHLHPGIRHQDDLMPRSDRMIRFLPFKYYVFSQLCFFIMEFIMPLCFGYFSRFSALSEEKALKICVTLQNSKYLLGRIVMLQCKAPVLLSLEREP